jgi:hypothetical protein
MTSSVSASASATSSVALPAPRSILKKTSSAAGVATVAKTVRFVIPVLTRTGSREPSPELNTSDEGE